MTRGRYRKGFFVGKLYHIGSNDPSNSRRKVDYMFCGQKWKGMGECSNHHGGCISRSQLGAVLFQSCTNRRNLRRSQGNTLKEAILVLLRSHYEGCFAQS